MHLQLTNLTKRLMAIPSVTGDLDECNKTLELVKQELANFTPIEFEKDGVRSLLFHNLNFTQSNEFVIPVKTGIQGLMDPRVKPEDDKSHEKDNVSTTKRKQGQHKLPKFRLILNAHLDVVPAHSEQFTPVEKDGKIYGRGAQDMKSGAAALILAFRETASKVNYPLGLQIVTDEETGGFKGAKHQLQQGVETEFILSGEPTDLTMMNEAKGPQWIKITSGGKSAHGAWAWEGKNAIDKLRLILNDLRKAYPEPVNEVWETTLNIATIGTSNTAQNKVPDDAYAILDFRVIPPDIKNFKNIFEKIIDKKATIEYMAAEPCQFTAKNNPDIETLKNTIEEITKKPAIFTKFHGGSDVRHYSSTGAGAVLFGPNGAGLHTDSEWVETKSIADYHAVILKFVTAIT